MSVQKRIEKHVFWSSFSYVLASGHWSWLCLTWKSDSMWSFLLRIGWKCYESGIQIPKWGNCFFCISFLIRGLGYHHYYSYFLIFVWNVHVCFSCVFAILGNVTECCARSTFRTISNKFLQVRISMQFWEILGLS